ncbi:sigma-54 interaction domain-containing protein [Odoribacter lunatus]|uniref:sigma-54 interaction domain-containing protein n=1 Tax=Odoribacter lunatus TaxID=2941335 RepID=UPI00203DFF47|nr:sigma-54 dependent transcriptional regulator [Odoribacter lunatus]
MENLQAIKQRFEIIGNNDGLNRAIDIATQVAPTDLSVLITGESGVGKEVFPRIIHAYSTRKHATYIAVNCGAIPEGTIDSELFGHEKGAFTGALSDRKGYFEVTDGGTIFLDEVGELPLATQSRLLRVLESGEFIRVGSSKVLKTNVRVIAATNLNIPAAIKNGKFREDLYYRLNTIPISIPPLRERKSDITLLFRKFAADFAEKYRMPPIRLTEDAMLILEEYRWPGNIRQLKNITEQISIIEQERNVDALTLKKYLPIEQNSLPALSAGSEQHDTNFASEREILYKILFDMKKDMNDLKRLVYGMLEKGEASHPSVSDITSLVLKDQYPTLPSEVINSTTDAGAHPLSSIQETEAVIEESFSLEEKEKELIVKALEKNHSKRKLAAKDLGISERTLYRKLKEYNLEDF